MNKGKSEGASAKETLRICKNIWPDVHLLIGTIKHLICVTFLPESTAGFQMVEGSVDILPHRNVFSVKEKLLAEGGDVEE